MKLTVAQALEAMNALGDIEPGQDVELSGVSTDSRVVRPGELFVCLTGENFDGHNFAEKAVTAGAAAIVVSMPMPQLFGRVPVLMVPDTLAALGKLGAHWRDKAASTVVAITGSAGKTTVKEMLAAILSEMGETARNYKNFNNQLGVPRCMLGNTGDEAFWVLELGISLPGDMDELAAMVRPDVAVIHNIGPAHLEGLGSLEGVAHAKADLLKYLPAGGKAFVSMDYPALWQRAQELFPGVVGFSSRGAHAAYTASYLGMGEAGGRYALDLDGTTLEVDLPFTGQYMAENVLAAATTAANLGAEPGHIALGLARTCLPEHRCATRTWRGWTLVDDTYNANPLSMKSAIESASEMAGDRPLVLVLGEMRELGDTAAREHRALGRIIARTHAAAVFYKGDFAVDMSEGLGNGAWPGNFVRVETAGGFPDAFAELGLADGVVLFKGSRSLEMEMFVQALADDENGENRS